MQQMPCLFAELYKEHSVFCARHPSQTTKFLKTIFCRTLHDPCARLFSKGRARTPSAHHFSDRFCEASDHLRPLLCKPTCTVSVATPTRTKNLHFVASMFFAIVFLFYLSVAEKFDFQASFDQSVPATAVILTYDGFTTDTVGVSTLLFLVPITCHQST